MIIGILGHGVSGGSAIVDVLKEFEEIKMTAHDREFPIAYAPDGLLDLEYHLVKQPVRYYSSDIALHRFLEYVKKEQKYSIHYSKDCKGLFEEISNEFIEEITQAKWKGHWYFDYYFHSLLYDKIRFSLGKRIDAIFEKYTGISISKPRYMRISVKPENFYEASRKYVRNILKAMDISTDDKVLLDTPFPYNDPESCFKFFDDPVAIIVNRDPRDVYVFFKEHCNESWVPCDTVDNFISYFRAIRSVDYKETNQIAVFQYEDLIFHYDDVRNRLIEFLNIKNPCLHNKNKCFDPKVSVGNIQIYKNYPQYEKDIKLIEKAFPEYLYQVPEDFGGLDRSNAKVFLASESQKNSVRLN